MKERNNLNFLRRRLGHPLPGTLPECQGAVLFDLQLWASLQHVPSSFFFRRVVKPGLGRLSKLKLNHSHPAAVPVIVLL